MFITLNDASFSQKFNIKILIIKYGGEYHYVFPVIISIKYWLYVESSHLGFELAMSDTIFDVQAKDLPSTTSNVLI